jgi:Domain of unknown function (DUF4111)
MFTPFEDLDELLVDFTGSVRDILGGDFVGAYLQGSFALGAGDRYSDCDFIVVTAVAPSGPAEAALRGLHRRVFTRPGHWSMHLDGSYADAESLRTTDGLGTNWLYCGRGGYRLVWGAHCNTLGTRWILRKHGITLAGPPAADLVETVAPQAMRDGIRTTLLEQMSDLNTWARFDVAWTQRFTVAAYCRALYTLHTGEVTSKRGALEWAHEHLDPKWGPMFTQVIEDRTLGWDPTDPPRPGSLDEMREFADYAESCAR